MLGFVGLNLGLGLGLWSVVAMKSIRTYVIISHIRTKKPSLPILSDAYHDVRNNFQESINLFNDYEIITVGVKRHQHSPEPDIYF